jgi:hypothetical protein
MTLSPPAQELALRLGDATNAVAPTDFPRNRSDAARPGMYSWWGDDAACAALGEELGCALPTLLYVGQAGATKWPSGKLSTATLATRIGTQHIRGNARSSTFRLTISALLLTRLALVSATGGKLERASNAIVTSWIAQHLRVAIAPFDDRDTLAALEAEVVPYLDPPLNLDHCGPTNARARLTQLRRLLPR